MDWVLVWQALALLSCILYNGIRLLLTIPVDVARSLRHKQAQYRRLQMGTADSKEAATEPAVFYEGLVHHTRRAPKTNCFTYSVRVGVLSLDNPPSWFAQQAKDHLTADAARSFAGTHGPVQLLTSPEAAGYIQNPISVYYCYNREGQLQRCIAEVTNTPWGERVTFAFNPTGQAVSKALHVSPFMDMQNTWHLRTSSPGDTLRLQVNASHPTLGPYFTAELVAVRSTQPSVRSEEGGFDMLLRYGYQPHRTALLIYWQAVKILWKGVQLYPPPSKVYQQALEIRGGTCPTANVKGSTGGTASSTGGMVGSTGSTSSSTLCSGQAHGSTPMHDESLHVAVGNGCCSLQRLHSGTKGDGGLGSAAGNKHPRAADSGRWFVWRAASGWPWNGV